MHIYMQYVTSQQATNHRGQVQLNETFYQYNMHQQSQDPSPFPWPTPEQFGATVAWPGDKADFETRAGPAEAPGDDGGAQEDDNMADVLDFFTCEGRVARPRPPKIVILSLFDVIAFSCYFVISF